MPIKITELAQELKSSEQEIRFILQIIKMPVIATAETISDEHIAAIHAYLHEEEEGMMSTQTETKKVVEEVVEEKIVKKVVTKTIQDNPDKVNSDDIVQDNKTSSQGSKTVNNQNSKAGVKAQAITKKSTSKPAFNRNAPRGGAQGYHKNRVKLDSKFRDGSRSGVKVKKLQLEHKKLNAQELQKQAEKTEQRLKLRTSGIEIPELISVKEFAEKIYEPASEIIKVLIKNGMMVTLNHKIDFDICEIIAAEFGVKLKKAVKSSATQDLLAGDLVKILQDDKKDLVKRPPIISVMGHVDHGKTKLLDYIRKTNIAEKESGGITQSIGAYQINIKGDDFTFLDTPGHEAFTAMRARGAKATDIAILVVAADEGVKPQTIEAIHHARDAKIPIIVALNKMDKEGADPDKLKAELAEHELVSEEWGGDTIIVPISALNGNGIDKLLTTITLVAEMHNLQANPNRSAVATVIESHQEAGLGVVATILINAGTLKLGENFTIGEGYGRIRTIKDCMNKNVKKALPATPVQISGVTGKIAVGDILQVVKNEKVAREKAQEIIKIHSDQADGGGGNTLAEIMNRINLGKIKQLKIILKSDTVGSLEAVRAAILKASHAEVIPNIIHSGIGEIIESDIIFAAAAGAIIVGFNTNSTQQAKKMAEKEGVEMMNFRVIYHLIEKVESILEGLLDPDIQEIELGDLKVLQIFLTPKGGHEMIIGGKVVRGLIKNKTMVRIIRGDKDAGKGTIKELRSTDKQATEIKEGNECGLKVLGTNLAIEVGDIIVSYEEKRTKKKLKN